MTRPTIALWVALLTLAACGETSMDDDRQQDIVAPASLIHSGNGVTSDGARVGIGDNRGAVEAAWGAPYAVRDLSPLAIHLVYFSRGVIVRMTAGKDSGVASFELLPAFSGWTEDGIVGVGDARAAALEALGAPAEEPFLGTVWDPELGLGFTWDGASVGSILVFAPSAP